MARGDTAGSVGANATERAFFKEGDELAVRADLSKKWLGALDNVMVRKAAAAGPRQAGLRDGLVAAQREVTQAAVALLQKGHATEPEEMQAALEQALEQRADRMLQEMADQAGPESMRAAA